MIILGAGLSGLIAGNMLRRFKPIIYEAQPSLPNNHAALLRFRSLDVSNACAVPFKCVKVHKSVYMMEEHHNSATMQMMNYYSYKVTGEYSQRSLENLQPVQRYISPPDFITQAAQQLNIKYSTEVTSDALMASATGPCISTIPMDRMMNMMGWGDQPEFKYKPIWTITANVTTPCDLYQTIHYPGNEPYYRCSITGNKLTMEFAEYQSGEKNYDRDQMIENVLIDFGMDNAEIKAENVETKMQKYGKIMPIDERIRKEFMVWLTREHNIYSLGRFATWRQILLDDVVKDVNVIEGLMNSGAYATMKHASKVA